MECLQPKVILYCLSRIILFNCVSHIFSTTAATWRKHRKLIAPSFGLTTIYSHLNIFNKHARSLAQLAAKHINSSKFDIRFPVNVTTIDMFLESTLGSKLSTNDKSMYAELFNK